MLLTSFLKCRSYPVSGKAPVRENSNLSSTSSPQPNPEVTPYSSYLVVVQRFSPTYLRLIKRENPYINIFPSGWSCLLSLRRDLPDCTTDCATISATASPLAGSFPFAFFSRYPLSTDTRSDFGNGVPLIVNVGYFLSCNAAMCVFSDRSRILRCV